MTNISIEALLAYEEKKREKVLSEYDRATSAEFLALMALEHNGRGAECAAKLLLALENETSFDFTLLLSLDSANRAHADLVILGYKAHDIWPSKWMVNTGITNGEQLMADLKEKWG